MHNITYFLLKMILENINTNKRPKTMPIKVINFKIKIDIGVGKKLKCLYSF